MKDGAVYEDLVDFKTLKTFMENQLEDYNMEPGVIGMDLVLFKDAIEHGMLLFLDFVSQSSSERTYGIISCLEEKCTRYYVSF